MWIIPGSVEPQIFVKLKYMYIKLINMYTKLEMREFINAHKNLVFQENTKFHVHENK